MASMAAAKVAKIVELMCGEMAANELWTQSHVVGGGLI